MALLFYFIAHNKSFIILKLKAWPAPLMQTTPGIPLQHKWPYQAKEKTTLKITKIWCLTKKNPKYLLQQCHETLSSSTSKHVCHPSGPGFAVKERASPKLRLLRTSQFSPTRPSKVLRLCKNQMGPHCYPIQLALFLAGTLRRLLLERSETGPPILLVPTAGGETVVTSRSPPLMSAGKRLYRYIAPQISEAYGGQTTLVSLKAMPPVTAGT